jgi:hypothetical protein
MKKTMVRVLIPTIGSLLICAGVAYAGNLTIEAENGAMARLRSKPAIYSRAPPIEPITPAEKQMLDTAGRTWVGDARRPRNTPFVQRVIEEVKRDRMW